MNILDHTKAHQRFFEEMTRIPHGSFHEQAYSDYLVEFAKAHNLSYVQDEHLNVIIYAPGSKGYEDHAPLVLQAHMDMVCEKNKDVEFQFERDALDLYIEDGWLKARGTTLGADDGCGVAYMLAILDGDMPHPPLECVFTVQEEVGLFGALGLDPKHISAKRMINLDDGGEKCTCTTSAGGVNVIATMDFELRPAEHTGYQLSVSGLSGGHSGGEIHREKGNANKILARLLYEISKFGTVSLAHVEGGMKDNAIPREAFARFTFNGQEEKLRKAVAQESEKIQKELEFSDAGVCIHVQKADVHQVIRPIDSMMYIRLMVLLPHGVHHRSMTIEGLTTASMNAAVVTCTKDTITVNCSIRGALESYIDQVAQGVELLAEDYGFETHREARYPAWSYEAVSPMRECFQRVFKERYGEELALIAVHGGLECGIFKAIDPDMDIITMGPIMEDIHTPQERLNLDSFDRTFALLCAVMEQL